MIIMVELPLKNSVVAYSTMSVTLLNPVSQPAPTYGVDTLLSGVGILNPLASGGHPKQHLYVDKEGNLREVSMGQYGQGYVSTNLGYKHIFGPMQEDFDICLDSSSCFTLEANSFKKSIVFSVAFSCATSLWSLKNV